MIDDVRLMADKGLFSEAIEAAKSIDDDKDKSGALAYIAEKI